MRRHHNLALSIAAAIAAVSEPRRQAETATSRVKIKPWDGRIDAIEPQPVYGAALLSPPDHKPGRLLSVERYSETEIHERESDHEQFMHDCAIRDEREPKDEP